MTPVPVFVRYRYAEGGNGGKDAGFHGLFYERSEAAVLGRLRELHRLADWVEIVEVRWRDAEPAGGWPGADRAEGLPSTRRDWAR